MPTLVLTDPVNDTLTDANVIANNNTALKNIINGGITNDNISGSASIAVAKIAAGSNGYILTSTAGVTTWEAAPATPQEIPAGSIMPYAGSAAPSAEWLLCDGSSVSQATYAALYAVIGVTFGNPGGGNFNVPNFKGKVPVGKDAAQTEFDTLAETGGAKTHALVTAELASHTHTYDRAYSTGDAQGGGGGINPFNSHASTASGSAGSGTAHNNLQPYLVVNYIIKT